MNYSKPPRFSKSHKGKFLKMAQETSEPRAPSEVVYYNPIDPPPGVGSVSPAGVGAGPGSGAEPGLDPRLLQSSFHALMLGLLGWGWGGVPGSPAAHAPGKGHPDGSQSERSECEGSAAPRWFVVLFF